MLNVTDARTLAESAHGDRRDKLGFDEIDHVTRVAGGTAELLDRAYVTPIPVEHVVMASAVAWLHDAVEDRLVSHRTAWRLMSPVQYGALLLVTREPGNGLTYIQYVEEIRDAAGMAGVIARAIKRADLHDNMTRACPPEMEGMRLPGGRYYRAAAILGETE